MAVNIFTVQPIVLKGIAGFYAQLRQLKAHWQEAQMACEVINGKENRLCATVDLITELCKRLAVSDELVRQLTEELAKGKAQFLTVAGNLQLSDKLISVEMECDIIVEDPSAARAAHMRVECLVRSVFEQSIKMFYIFPGEVDTEFVDRF